MSSDKPDIYPFDGELDNYDKAMVIATNIKHVMLVADIINAIETLLYICITLPLSFFHYLQPILQGSPCIRESGNIIFEWFFSYYFIGKMIYIAKL